MAEPKDVAYVISQSVCAMIEAMGMMAENMYRQHHGQSMAYVDADFFKLIEKYGIYHNSVVGIMQG